MIARVGRSPLGVTYRSALGALRTLPTTAAYLIVNPLEDWLPGAVPGIYRVQGAMSAASLVTPAATPASGSIARLPVRHLGQLHLGTGLYDPAANTAERSPTLAYFDLASYDGAIRIASDFAAPPGFAINGRGQRHLAVMPTTEFESGSPVTRPTIFGISVESFTGIGPYVVTVDKLRAGLTASTLSVSIDGAALTGATSGVCTVRWLKSDGLRLYLMAEMEARIPRVDPSPGQARSLYRLLDVNTLTGAVSVISDDVFDYPGANSRIIERLQHLQKPMEGDFGIVYGFVGYSGVVTAQGTLARWFSGPDLEAPMVRRVYDGSQTTLFSLPQLSRVLSLGTGIIGANAIRRDGHETRELQAVQRGASWMVSRSRWETRNNLQTYITSLQIYRDGELIQDLLAPEVAAGKSPDSRGLVAMI